MNKQTNVSRETTEQKQLKAIGRAFRIARGDKSLLLQDIAEKSGVSTLTISKLERGQLENSSLQTLNKIAEVLELKITFTVEKK